MDRNPIDRATTNEHPVRDLTTLHDPLEPAVDTVIRTQQLIHHGASVQPEWNRVVGPIIHDVRETVGLSRCGEFPEYDTTRAVSRPNEVVFQTTSHPRDAEDWIPRQTEAAV